MSRRLERFNDSFGRIAVAGTVEQSQGGMASAVDPAAVAVVLGELESKDDAKAAKGDGAE